MTGGFAGLLRKIELSGLVFHLFFLIAYITIQADEHLFRTMKDDDVFTAMVKEEFNQYQHFLLFKDRKELENGNYRELAEKMLRQVRILSIFVLFSILLFSLFSVFHFIDYGNTGNTVSFWLGVATWAFVIFSTIFYTRDILERKKSMQRILKLLEAKEEYFRNKNRKPEKEDAA